MAGNAYSWGKGDFGVLGLGDIKDVVLPEKLPLSKALQVSCGLRQTICLTTTGVFFWGCDYSTPLSESDSKRVSSKAHPCPTFTIRLSPIKINVDSIKSVSAGDQHCLMIDENQDIWAFGSNLNGQLGIGSKKNANIPVKVKTDGQKFRITAAGSHSAAVSCDGSLYIWGTGLFGEWLSPKLVVQGDFIQLSLSSGLGLAVDHSGKVHSWGNNTEGELGLGDFDQRTGINQVKLLEKRGIRNIFSFNSSVIAIGKTLEPSKKYRRSQQMNKENIEPKVKEIENLRNILENKDMQIKTLQNGVDDSSILKIQKENQYFRNAFEDMKKFKQQCYYSLTQEAEKRKIAEGFVKELHNEHKMLVGTIEELEKTMAKLSKQCEVYQEKAEKHDVLLERFQRVIVENERLKERNEGFSYRYKNDFSCESITLASPDISLVDDKRNKKDSSPELRLRTSKSSSELLKLFDPQPIRSASPVVVENNNDPQTPPTFRDRGINNSGNVKNSLIEIRARLNQLQENKKDLEGKMSDFERRLKEEV
jgi:hypothetical protein